jgi:hypothetical protein
MSGMRVTDLERFALHEVLKPFWPTLQANLSAVDSFRRTYRVEIKQDRYGDTLTHNINEVAQMLDIGPIEWRMAVCRRLARMGVWFPDYIEHKLAIVVRVGMGMAMASEGADE